MSTIGLLYALIIVNVLLIGRLVLRPELTRGRRGKILGFGALFVLPILALTAGTSEKLERSKTTEFCLSCHEMQPYGRSLYIDDEEYIPARHFQKRLIDREFACFTCHTDYTMFGDVNSKMRGLRHVYVHYFGTIPEKLALYSPYQNRECLHCHLGARSFEEGWAHEDDMSDLIANELSCRESGCHDVIHDAAIIDEQDFWEVPSHE